MADNWILSQEVDLQRGVQAPQVWPNALIVCGDNKAHTWRVTIMDDGRPAALSGTVTGYFIRGDDATVLVAGKFNGNVATVTLAQSCYNVEGNMAAVMRLKTSTGLITLAALILPVRRMITDTIVDTENIIPSLDDLLAQIERMEASTKAADTATNKANTAASNADAKAAAANTAAGAASTAANAANAAAARLDGLTATAEGLPAGSAPTVSVTTGEDGARVLAFGIPKGDKGDTGAQGEKGDTGAQGEKGDTGAQGEKGDTGATPQLTVNVATGEPGTQASVTQSGTAENPVINLTIPRGDTGNIGSLTINGKTPDASGTVVLEMDDIDGLSEAIANAGCVKTVAGVEPDASGNITLTGQDVPMSATDERTVQQAVAENTQTIKDALGGLTFAVNADDGGLDVTYTYTE